MTNGAKRLIEALENAPMIASVKNDEGLERALESTCEVIFLLYGNLCTIGDLTRRVKDAGKLVFVHLDLVEGLGNRDIVVDFIHQNTAVDGIISTRPNLIRRARELGLICIQRFFLLDSMALENVVRQASFADAVEVLPATLPKVIARVTERLQLPLIAGGLVSDKEDILCALKAGALAVSATNPALWFM